MSWNVGLENILKALLLGASLLLAFPAVAAAQSASTGPSLPSAPPAMRVPGAIKGAGPFERAAAMEERLRRDGAGTPSQRRERAGRLAEMVNSGQCQAAHDIAVREGDRVMAERIGDVCRPSADPTPAA